MFVTNWISTTKIQKISEITNFFRHYFLSRTEVTIGKNREFHKNNYSAPVFSLCWNCAIRKIIGENGQGSTYIQDW